MAITTAEVSDALQHSFGKYVTLARHSFESAFELFHVEWLIDVHLFLPLPVLCLQLFLRFSALPEQTNAFFIRLFLRY